MNTDVLIIGAGPTGLSLACQLVRYGVDFVIVEKQNGVTPFSKAIGMHARTHTYTHRHTLGVAKRTATNQGPVTFMMPQNMLQASCSMSARRSQMPGT